MTLARHLLVYFAAGGGLLWLTRKFVQPVGIRMFAFLLLVPLALTGRAVFSGGTYAPIDISYQTDPLQSVRERFGIGPPARAILGDVANQRIPWRKAIREAVKKGRLPIWNRFLLGGEPLLAVMQPAVLHPFTWIGMLLPLDQAWTLETSLGLLLALVSAFALFADLGLPALAAALGAVGWAFCDYLRFYSGWALSPAAAVFPLILLGLRRIALRRRGNGFAITVAALALCVAGGHPETALHCVLGGGIWFLIELTAAPRGSRWRSVAEALLAGVAAAGVTAVLLLPHVEALRQTLEYFFRSTWWVHQHKADSLAQSLSTMQQALVPYALGVSGFGNTAAGSQVPQAYTGAVLLPFAAIGLMSRRREKWACVALIVVGFGAWCRFPILADAISSLPLLDLALNERLVFLGCLSVALLAALGAERLIAERRSFFLAVPLGALAVLLIYRLEPRPAFDARDARRISDDAPSRAARASRDSSASCGLFRGARSDGSRASPSPCLLLLAQRVVETWHVYPVAPRGAFYPRLEVLAPIPRDAPYRMAALGMAFIPNVSAMYEVEDVRGYEAMTFLRFFETYPLWCVHQPVWFNRVDDPTRPFLSFLNVRYVLAAPGVATPAGWPVLASASGGRLVENPTALPRAFIPREVQVQPDPQARLRGDGGDPGLRAEGFRERATGPRSPAGGARTERGR